MDCMYMCKNTNHLVRPENSIAESFYRNIHSIDSVSFQWSSPSDIDTYHRNFQPTTQPVIQP